MAVACQTSEERTLSRAPRGGDMSRIGTDFLHQQADLFLHVGRRTVPSRDELEGRINGFSPAPFLLHHIRELGARRVLSVGSGTGMLELAIAKLVPDVRFVLVEPSVQQLALFEHVLDEEGIERRRFELFQGYFRDYAVTDVDLIMSVHAWYYAHSAEELHRAMRALYPRGRLLLQMWAAGSLISRLCTDIGAAGKSRLGHLLSAEEVRDCAKELGYRVDIEYFDYRDYLDPSERAARAAFVEVSLQTYRRAVAEGPSAESVFWSELAETDRGRAHLNAFAYFTGVPVSSMDNAWKAEAWAWLAKHYKCHQRCARLVIRHP